jgi:hypothetical protein
MFGLHPMKTCQRLALGAAPAVSLSKSSQKGKPPHAIAPLVPLAELVELELGPRGLVAVVVAVEPPLDPRCDVPVIDADPDPEWLPWPALPALPALEVPLPFSGVLCDEFPGVDAHATNEAEPRSGRMQAATARPR